MTELIKFHLPYQYDKSVEHRAINMREIERTFNGLISGDIPVGTTTGTWTDFTPTVSATTGSITTVSATGRYIQTGGITYFKARITVTTNGTGAGQLRMTLPVDSATLGQLGSGLETTTGDMLSVRNTAFTEATIVFYNGNYPAVDGSIIDVEGFYEAA